MVEPLSTGGRPAPSRPSRSPAKPLSPADGAPQAAPRGDRLMLAEGLSAPTLRPTPVLPDGNLDYYRRRHQDFQARYPQATPPTYYLGYGDVYVRRFTEVLSPELSKEGQEWMVRARKNLQVAIEAELARNPGIERDDAAFTAFAYATHSRAYLDAGLTDLPIDDLIRVAATPNLRDTLNPTGLAVIAETAEVVARDKLAAALDAPAETAQELLDAIKTSPDLVRDVARLLATEENAEDLLDGLVKLKAMPGNVAVRLMDRLWTLTAEGMQDALDALRNLLPVRSAQERFVGPG